MEGDKGRIRVKFPRVTLGNISTSVYVFTSPIRLQASTSSTKNADADPVRGLLTKREK